MDKSRDPLGRGLQIVRYLVEHPSTHLGVREIAKALEMQPSTVSRLLAALHRERFVQRDSVSGGYMPHLEFMRLGLLTAQKLDIRSIARPYMEGIVAACNESVFLGMYDPAVGEMLRVENVQSSNPLRYVVETDRWTEIYRGASGLGIMAFLPPAEREAILARAEEHASDAEPWLRRERLEPLLESIREQGYALTHGRRKEGAVGMAAPIFDASGRVIGDMILTLPELRFSAEIEHVLVTHVMDAADAITREIGGKPLGRPRPLPRGADRPA